MQFEFAGAQQSSEPGFIEVHGSFVGAPFCFVMPIGKALEMAGAIEAQIQTVLDRVGHDEARVNGVG